MKKTFAGSEKRQSPRFKVIFPFEISGEDFRLTAFMKDISDRGLFCETDRYIPVRTKLKISIGFPELAAKKRIDKEVSCFAEVARIEPPMEKQKGHYSLGIKFEEISAAEKALIMRFIRRRNLKEAEELRKMYLELKTMVAHLVAVEESHPTAEHFRKVINGAIQELDDVAVILECEINELKNQ
ncbi:MAG: PilZ domain-containing protein [Candidatus Omnitrophica bacterium]|nr:PilZ domain-containing protein [Candidatus Omnitrophota bacterium]MBU4479033.1 PilZ domain-containing protein [Candidatus Omnitrophota bacterium]MCG2703047.1 PilZ domain-containing protein [Candidatus Omnitrophota bacterium]